MTEATARFDVAAKKLDDLTGLADHMEKRIHLMQDDIVQKATSTADHLDARLKTVEKMKPTLKTMEDLNASATSCETRLKKLEMPWLGMPPGYGRLDASTDGLPPTSSLSKTEEDLESQLSLIEKALRANDPKGALKIVTEAHEEETSKLRQEKQSIEETLLGDLEQTKAKLVEGEKKQKNIREELQALTVKYNQILSLQTSRAPEQGATVATSAIGANVDMSQALKGLSAKAAEVETKARRLDEQLALLEQEKAARGVEMQAAQIGLKSRIRTALNDALAKGSALTAIDQVPISAGDARALAKKAQDAEKRAREIEGRVAQLEKINTEDALAKKANGMERKASKLEERIMQLEQGGIEVSVEKRKKRLEEISGLNWELKFDSQQKVDEECQLLKQKLERFTVKSRGLGEIASTPVAAGRVYEITLDKSNGERLGVDVDQKDGQTLLVEKVYSGLVETWNSTNPDREVKIGHHICEVNGIKGDVLKLIDEFKKNQVHQVKLKTGDEADDVVAEDPNEKKEEKQRMLKAEIDAENLRQENQRLSIQLQQLQRQGASQKAAQVGLKSRIRVALNDALASSSVQSAIDQEAEALRIKSSKTAAVETNTSVRTDTYALEQLSLQLQSATQENDALRLQHERGVGQLNSELQQKAQEYELLSQLQKKMAKMYDEKDRECQMMQNQFEQMQATQRDLPQADPDQALRLQEKEQQVQQLSAELLQLRQNPQQAAQLQELTIQLEQLSVARQQDQAQFSMQLQQKEVQCQQQAEAHRGDCEAYKVELEKLRREPPGQQDIRREMNALLSEKQFLTKEVMEMKVKYEDMAEEKIGMEAQLDRGRRAVEASNAEGQKLRLQMEELERKKLQIQESALATRRELEFQLESEKKNTVDVSSKCAMVQQAQDQLEQDLTLYDRRIQDTFLSCANGIYRVDNSRLDAHTPGLNYRVRKSMDTTVKSDIFAAWDCLVAGFDEGDGWLRVGSHYLPFSVSGVPVLTPGLDTNRDNEIDVIDQLRDLYMEMRASLEVCHKTAEDQAEQLAKMRLLAEHKVLSPAKQVGQVDISPGQVVTPAPARNSSPMAHIQIETLESAQRSLEASAVRTNLYSQPPSPPTVETSVPTVVTRGGGSLTMPGLSPPPMPTVGVGTPVSHVHLVPGVTTTRAPNSTVHAAVAPTHTAAVAAVEYVNPAAHSYSGRVTSQPGLISSGGLSAGSFTASPFTASPLTPSQPRAAERFIAMPSSAAPAMTTTPVRAARPSAASMQLQPAAFVPPGAAPVTQSRTQSGQSTSSSMARGVMASLAPARPRPAD